MAISEIKKRKKRKFLPSEVVSNIFARLSIETLHNVILVNKFCLKLISTPAFARAHLKHSNQGKTSNLYDCKLICSKSYNLEVKQFSLASLLFHSRSVNVVNLNYPKLRKSWPERSFHGSCDGLVCLVLNENKYVFLWNPCTRKSKRLPRIIYDFDCDVESLNMAYGLGYDESTDDFKLVAFCSMSYDKPPRDYEVYVFSLKRNSWKRIHQDLKCSVPEFDSGKLLSGKLHWLSGEQNMDDTKKIVSFDVGSEVFGIVEPPSDFEDGWFDMTLDVLEGCICLLIRYEEQTRVDLWVLKKYGVNESWTKVVTISCVGIPDFFRFYKAIVLQNDEILFFASYGSFAVYNPKESSFRFPGTRKLDHISHDYVFYVPSLVSPVA